MKFNVFTDMEYQIQSASTLLLSINALRNQHQTVLSEEFTISPYIKTEELPAVNGENRLIRFEVAEATTLKISYKATVDNCYKLVEYTDKPDIPVANLDPLIIPYLNPSRYCQSDKLFRLANNQFGHITNSFEKVLALTTWINQNVEYLSGFSNASTSAFDTVTEQAGVCRDFAHLGITLCRALNIPARYFTGYSYMLKPADFHACFEAYLGGEWILFDATGLAPLNGMVKIATGRDAADAAIANLFGDVLFTSMIVGCNLADGEIFIPFNYSVDSTAGICYL
ncbi:transglutaminase-like domain-containing protein [Mucilaginibacter auburnensis]|uniref:Transglutaminase-like putative cysteine protease n=1 Tax=Mucilaginibacter auburnensis TaxID=1457233 RepID=A0A2H9VNA2_9SPHI|nr:transglutaminase family protein [Mucilaginibacter auburnensis]PJJ79802.1 transglutaminase-like putative cysteine protease [Mucilaginibacter auburnensis]